MVPTKTCSLKTHQGSRVLPLSEFPKDRSRPDGLHSNCKACVRARKAKWLQRVKDGDPSVQHISEHRKAHRQQSAKHKQKRGFKYTILASARNRAKRKHLAFDLTLEDIVIPQKCPMLGLNILQQWESHRNHTKEDGYPTIDRIDSTKGYTKDNIQIISWRANNLKSNASLQEMVELGVWAKQQLEL